VWRETDNTFHDGSPLVALHEAKLRSPFSDYCIADLDPTRVSSCATRLEALGAVNVHQERGTAEETVGRLVQKLDRKYGFHIAMLDPCSLDALPFSVIDTLGKAYKHIDLIIHFSKQDFQRNLARFISGSQRSLDRFAPEWKTAVGDLNAPQGAVRAQVVKHWLDLIRAL
jgi:three-Cys-motif partner protein